MKIILQITPSGVSVSDLYGDSAVRTPEIFLMSRADLIFDLRSSEQDESGMLAPLKLAAGEIKEWYFALDRDFDSATGAKLLITSGISCQVLDDETLLFVNIPNTGTGSLAQDMAGKASQNYTCELGAFDFEGRALHTWQFEITVKNRIYPGTVPPEVVSDPQYLTALQIRALMSDLTGFTEEQLKEI